MILPLVMRGLQQQNAGIFCVGATAWDEVQERRDQQHGVAVLSFVAA